MDLNQEVERLREISEALEAARKAEERRKAADSESATERGRRDEAIRKLDSLGLQQPKIAEEVGISTARVSQIVTAARRRDQGTKRE